MSFDIEKIRSDFPALQQKMRGGHELVYFDNAATSQKPKSVIEAECDFYSHDNANIHRSAHELSARSTSMYEAARDAVLKFFKAGPDYCAVFTRGATEALNLTAQSWGRKNIGSGDEILLTQMEHHANIVRLFSGTENLTVLFKKKKKENTQNKSAD